MSFTAITDDEVAAKAPIDDALMAKIQADLNDLNSRLLITKSFPYQWKVNGLLNSITPRKLRRIDGSLVASATTFLQCKLWLENPGTGGTAEIDIRKITTPNTPITKMANLSAISINSIARVGSSINTQSIARATSQLATQSITQWKTSLNIQSIVQLGNNLWRLNLDSQPDSDWIVGDYITVASATDTGNNGSFQITRVNDDGANNVVVTNASGSQQSTVNGTVALAAWSYNFTGSVDSHFLAGQVAVFASHTTGANNGSLTIYKINQGGNNIIVKNASGVAQGGVAGTVDTQQFVYAYGSSVASDYVVGEYALMAGHSSGSSDGSFLIMAVNASAANNLVVYAPGGVTQGGAAGTANTQRWTYAFGSDPSADVAVNDTVYVAGATTSANNGTFTVKQVNRSASNNVILYNVSGAAQVGSAGTVYSTKIKLSFASDQSSVYTTSSYIELIGSNGGVLDDQNFKVTEINHGGGSNYNVVVDANGLAVNSITSVGNLGRIILEEKSIFTTRPSLTLPTDTTNATNRHCRNSGDGKTGAVDAVFGSAATVATGDLIAMYVTSIPTGEPENLCVGLA